MDTEITCLDKRPDFLAVTSMQACISSHKVKGCLNPMWSLEKTPSSASFPQKAAHTFDNSKGMQSSMLQKETMPDSS